MASLVKRLSTRLSLHTRVRPSSMDKNLLELCTRKSLALSQASSPSNNIDWSKYRYCADYMGTRFHPISTCCYACCRLINSGFHNCRYCGFHKFNTVGIHEACNPAKYRELMIICDIPL